MEKKVNPYSNIHCLWKKTPKKCFLDENKVKFCFNKAQLVENFVPIHLQEVIYFSSNKK